MSTQIGMQTALGPSVESKHAMAFAHTASLPVVSAFVMQHNSSEVPTSSHVGRHEGPVGAGVETGARPHRCGVGEGAPAGQATDGSAPRRVGAVVVGTGFQGYLTCSYKDALSGQRKVRQ